MNRCPLTYKEIPEGERYSSEGLKKLSRRLKSLQDLPYSAEEQRQEAVARASKMSVQGVQPKLSARLNTVDGCFDVVDIGGEYILKPQSGFPEVPQNEDLTMRLAEAAGFEVPPHGLIYSKDGSLTYAIKRFDRIGKKEKLALEDFAQLSGKSRETKYDSSMEQIAIIVDRFCTFPVVEKVKLFRGTLFNFLVGNEDAHLKNFSLIRREGKIELSPVYDLVNTTIAVVNAREEIALPLHGKKRNLSRTDLVDYYGVERLGLRDAVVTDVVGGLAAAFSSWERLVESSFLSASMKDKYRELLAKRRTVLGI